jgi:hypothetical protein
MKVAMKIVINYSRINDNIDFNYNDVDYDYDKSGFGGLGVACWPLVPKFTGSRSSGFLRAKKSSARLPSEGK